MQDSAQIIDTVRALIRQGGFKQGAVAERAGFSPVAFSAMLTGRKVIHAKYILPIANALGVTPNELFGLNGDKAN